MPQIRSVFFVTTMFPLTHATSVTTCISLHGPEHDELLDELDTLLDDEDEIADEDDDGMDADDSDELLESDDDTLDAEVLEVDELDDELLLELGHPPRIHHLPWCSAT